MTLGPAKIVLGKITITIVAFHLVELQLYK